jgi:hypothetical protein
VREAMNFILEKSRPVVFDERVIHLVLFHFINHKGDAAIAKRRS